MGDAAGGPGSLTVEFCGELYVSAPGERFTVGRDADLSVDDNPFLHRRLLEFVEDGGLWWMVNTGQSMSVSLSTGDGSYQALIGPAGRVPLVFPAMLVMFSAGPFTYELAVSVADSAFTQAMAADAEEQGGAETIGGAQLTPSQRLLVLALAEPVLRAGGVGVGELPSSTAAAARLGWPLTTFNRKLDAVCDKLARAGIPGLRGEAGRLARNRRSRLVEYSVLSRLVAVEDLIALDSLPAGGDR